MKNVSGSARNKKELLNRDGNSSSRIIIKKNVEYLLVCIGNFSIYKGNADIAEKFN